MKNWKTLLLVAAFLFVMTPAVWAANINLFEWATNKDGVIASGGAFGPFGTVTVNISGTGSHSVLGFFDYEIDEADNTFSNEYGAISGAPSAGQSWEIDEPGFVFGDIYTNFQAGILDNANGVPISAPDDVSMAMGWDFALLAGEQGTVKFVISDVAPTGGFYLSQTDPDSQATIYLTSSLDINPIGMPEPTTMLFLGMSLAGIAFTGRKWGSMILK